jgi:hypothetical protein
MFDKWWNNYNHYSRDRQKRFNMMIIIFGYLRSTGYIHLKLCIPETQTLLYAQNIPRILHSSHMSWISSAEYWKQLKSFPRLLIRHKPRALLNPCINHEHLNLNPKYVTIYLLIGGVPWNTVYLSDLSTLFPTLFNAPGGLPWRAQLYEVSQLCWFCNWLLQFLSEHVEIKNWIQLLLKVSCPCLIKCPDMEI